MQLKLALGLNRVKPVHELIIGEDGFCECSKLQNFITRDKKITKVKGTEAYNSSALTTAISWLHRTYHKRVDGSFTKVLFAFSNGTIYYGDDVAGTFTATERTGFDVNAIPMHQTMQVSGNSILYFYPGDGTENVKYDGNGSFKWESTTLNTDLGRTIESAVVHLDRMWYVSKNSSTVAYSTILKPEDLTSDAADIIVGEETDSVVRRIMLGASERLYIFKDQSIYEVYGRTPSTFQIRRITNKYGLATKRGIYPVGSGFVFLNTFDKELYFFGGTENSITPLTEETIRLREILDIVQIEKVDMTVQDGLFRFAFKHKDDSIYQNRELIYPVTEPRPDGTPKWSMIKGNKVFTYALLQLQGDKDILMMGRSDVGKAMYYGRSNSFDGANIETLLRTAELVASEDKDVRFKGFYVKGKPGSQNHPVKFRYYLNGRYATTNEQNLDTKGELRSLGSIKLSTQSLFNNRIIPMHSYSRGSSISFEISDFNAATEVEIYSIAVKVQARSKIRNQLVG